MKRVLPAVGTTALTGFLLMFFFTIAQASEVQTVSGTKITKRVISRSVMHPGVDQKHVMSQTVREDIITSTNPDWNDALATSYEQSDHVSGSGTHRGYMTITHKNGDVTYLKYAGTDTRSGAPGGAWEIQSEGTIEITGGTGTYKDMKGGGTYSGLSSPKGSTVRWEVRTQ